MYYWINQVLWDGNSYQLNAINEAGTEEQWPVTSLHRQFERKDARRIRITTDFQAWKSVGAELYLSGMNIRNEFINQHEIYEVEAGNKVFHIPAAVVLRAFFRPLHGLAPHLFRPQGLEDIVLPRIEDGKHTIGFFCSPSTLKITPSRDKALLEALSWFYCFPSARGAWDSVLHKARQGTLGVKLPQGEANIVLQAINHRGTWLVTELTVIGVKTEEMPYEFTADHTADIKFHHAKHEATLRTPKRLFGLPSGMHRFSDELWARLAPDLLNGRQNKHDLRLIIELIIKKFAQGIAWRRLDFGSLNKPIVVRTYQQMLQDGRWNLLLNKLAEIESIQR